MGRDSRLPKDVDAAHEEALRAEAVSRRVQEELDQLRSGLQSTLTGLSLLSNSLALTIVASFPVPGAVPDERGLIETVTFDYHAFRVRDLGVALLGEVESRARDARLEMVLSESGEKKEPS